MGFEFEFSEIIRKNNFYICFVRKKNIFTTHKRIENDFLKTKIILVFCEDNGYFVVSIYKKNDHFDEYL